MTRYTVEAFNTATKSQNKMHDDTVAKQFGFRGGLVPGVDVFAYLTHLPAARWGREWLDRGYISARFVTPVYDGDLVTVESDGDDLTLKDSGGNLCATGTASLPSMEDVARPPSADEIPPTAVEPELERASPEVLASFADGVLGSLEYGFHADKAGEYLGEVREQLPLYELERVAHPGWLLRMSNYALSYNVKLGPWIHVESRMQMFGAVVDGDRISVRSRVTGLTERKGHRFVDLDVHYVINDERVAATVAHTAIYEPRGARSVEV